MKPLRALAWLRVLLYPLLIVLVAAPVVITRHLSLDGVERNRFTGQKLLGTWSGEACRYYQEQLVMAVEMKRDDRGAPVAAVDQALLDGLRAEGYLTPPPVPLGHGAEAYAWDLTPAPQPLRVACRRHGAGTEAHLEPEAALRSLGVTDPAKLRRARELGDEEARRIQRDRTYHRAVEGACVLLGLGLAWLLVRDLATLLAWGRRRGAPESDDSGGAPPAA